MTAVCLIAISAGVSGCTTKALDRKIARLVEQEAAPQAGISEETVADASQESSVPDFPVGTTLSLNSTSVLFVATEYSRELQSRRDDLYRSGLSLFSTRRNFTFGVNGTVEYIFTGGEDRDGGERGNVALTLDRILPTGGEFKLTGRQNIARQNVAVERLQSYDGNVSATIDQPLLAGAGYGVSHEDLTQAERNYLYALRSFTLERQDFAIQTLRDYYGLITQRRVVENTATNYLQFVYLRERSEALFKVNRAPAIDVLRSQQEELTALNNLTTTRETFEIQLARFNISLGLPDTLATVIEDDVPELREVHLDENDAVDMALERRLDLMTQRNRVDDARRKLKVARNLFLPEVNAVGAINYLSEETESLTGQQFSQDWSVGVRAEIPLDLRDERDEVKQAMLNLDEAERQLTTSMDTIVLDVRESFSRLRTLEISVRIQLKNIEIAERRAENSLLRFRNGSLSNRDVVEAANELLSARNAYIKALTDYEIQRLTLLRRMGLLDISREGGIIELSPGT